MENELANIEMKIPGDTGYLELIRGVMELVTDKVNLNKIEKYKVILAVEEACANIIEHAYRGKGDISKGEDIELKVFIRRDSLKVTLKDKGVPFDPNQIKRPDLEKYVQEYRTGGLGIYIIESLMDEVKYDIVPGEANRIILTKKLAAAGR